MSLFYFIQTIISFAIISCLFLFVLSDSNNNLSNIKTEFEKTKEAEDWNIYDETGLNAVVLEGLEENDLKKIKGFKFIQPDFTVYKDYYSWGIHRITQSELILTNIYSPAYKGCGVDVYVVDSGIDTNHIEFTTVSGVNRNVTNIYNALDKGAASVSSNIDGDGHGTHCAGTVGGNTIGVAPCSNIYGLKVLSDLDGTGSTSDIIAALSVIKARHVSKPGSKTVVSMSLGGSCYYKNCVGDLEIAKIDEMVAVGIVFAVSAGNSAINAANRSPASAKKAITVTASTSTDMLASYSNFGSVVDIIAPGSDIWSACSSKAYQCTTESEYYKMSGTSMATPHVAGVIAQNLEKAGGYLQMTTLSDVMVVMNVIKFNDSVWNQITLSSYAISNSTVNLLLQIPKNDNIYGAVPSKAPSIPVPVNSPVKSPIQVVTGTGYVGIALYSDSQCATNPYYTKSYYASGTCIPHDEYYAKFNFDQTQPCSSDSSFYITFYSDSDCKYEFVSQFNQNLYLGANSTTCIKLDDTYGKLICSSTSIDSLVSSPAYNIVTYAHQLNTAVCSTNGYLFESASTSCISLGGFSQQVLPVTLYDVLRVIDVFAYYGSSCQGQGFQLNVFNKVTEFCSLFSTIVEKRNIIGVGAYYVTMPVFTSQVKANTTITILLTGLTSDNIKSNSYIQGLIKAIAKVYTVTGALKIEAFIISSISSPLQVDFLLVSYFPSNFDQSQIQSMYQAFQQIPQSTASNAISTNLPSVQVSSIQYSSIVNLNIVSTSPSPTGTPSLSPPVNPSVISLVAPSVSPSIETSVIPTRTPSGQPTVLPTSVQALFPSIRPSLSPSIISSVSPRMLPSLSPTLIPISSPIAKGDIIAAGDGCIYQSTKYSCDAGYYCDFTKGIILGDPCFACKSGQYCDGTYAYTITSTYDLQFRPEKLIMKKVNLYQIYYGDFGTEGNQMKQLIDYFAGNIGASDYYTTMTNHYYQTIGGVTTYATSNVSFGKSVSINTDLTSATLTTSLAIQEIGSLISSGSLPDDPDYGLYGFIFRGSMDFFDARGSSWAGGPTTGGTWCGFHDSVVVPKW